MSIKRGAGVAGLLVLALLSAATVARAEAPRFEAGAFGAWRVGGEFTAGADTDTERDVDLEEGSAWGLNLGWYRDPDGFYEFLYSRQSTRLDRNDFGPGAPDVTAEYYHLGGTLLLGTVPARRPYVSMTAGATRFDADGYSAETEFSVSLGTGLRVMLTEQLLLTAGLRGYLTFVDQDTRLFCVSDGGQGGCLLESSGSTIFQFEAALGLSARF